MTDDVKLKPAKDRDLNLQNVKLMSKLLKGLDHFIFFGTLLGFERERNVIQGDDDIDILIDIKHREEVADIMRHRRFRGNIDRQMKRWPSFLSVRRPVEGQRTIIDIYFYDNDADKDFIVEKWNFLGDFCNPESHIHIPKSMIFPLRQEKMAGIDVSVPADPAACCVFLYGEGWNVPRQKGTEYKMIVDGNAPKLVPL